MPEYQVDLEVWCGTTVTVEAEDEFEAQEAAYEHVPTICHHCASDLHGQSHGIELGEEWRARAVYDAKGERVWSEDSE